MRLAIWTKHGFYLNKCFWEESASEINRIFPFLYLRLASEQDSQFIFLQFINNDNDANQYMFRQEIIPVVNGAALPVTFNCDFCKSNLSCGLQSYQKCTQFSLNPKYATPDNAEEELFRFLKSHDITVLFAERGMSYA